MPTILRTIIQFQKLINARVSSYFKKNEGKYGSLQVVTEKTRRSKYDA